MALQQASSTSNEQVPRDEWQRRVDLAAAYQLAEINGWTMTVWNHISARVPGEEEHFLINELGLMYDEVTASNLVKIDIDGNRISGGGDTSIAGFLIHGAIHQAREDVVCVFHSHTPEGVAVSCLEEGFPALCGETAFFHHDLAYYEYQGVSVDRAEQAEIAEALGEKNHLIMANHGLTTLGRSVAEAYMRMYWLIYACRILTNVHAMGRPYQTLSKEIAELTARQNASYAAPGEFEWPALLRRLDRVAPHYKT